MIRRMLLMAAVGMLVAPAALEAQQGMVQATAVVGDHISVTGSGDLAFGTLTRGADAVINPTTSGVLRTVEYNLDVDVTFGVPDELQSGADRLPITFYCAHRLGTEAWQGEENECSNAILLLVGPSLTEATLGFGARILSGDIDAARAGTYTGTLLIYVTAR